MREFNYSVSVILVISFFMAVICLSSAVTLHTSSVYNYHFNDSEAMNKTNLHITGDEIAGEITGYFISVKKASFQVYEKNGKFKDPVFDVKEQEVMARSKRIVNSEAIAGLISLLFFILCYRYLYIRGFIQAIRDRMKIGIWAALVMIFIRVIVVAVRPLRYVLYNHIMGIYPGNKSILTTILGDPFFKSYLLFASLIALTMVAVTGYINARLTKPERIFY